MKIQPKLIIYTSVDGALYDIQAHSFKAARPALQAARERGVPIVLCSSRTRTELEELQRDLGIFDPLIIENGGAILIPEGYFPLPLKSPENPDGMLEIELGESYERLVRTLHRINHELPFEVRGFSDLSACELAEQAGMTLPEARRAKDREFDEPFTISSHSPYDLRRLREKIAEAGLRLTRRGRFYHLHSDAHKGIAVRILNALFRHFHHHIQTIGLGYDLNDLPMLSAVDMPIVMRPALSRLDEAWLHGIKNLRIAANAGPEGWNHEVLKILTEGTMARTSIPLANVPRLGTQAAGR